MSATGNGAAKVILSPAEHCDLFIVGDAAPEQTRKEMVDWLKVKYPSVRILALNLPGHELAGPDYNVKLDSHNPWLPMVGAPVSEFPKRTILCTPSLWFFKLSA